MTTDDNADRAWDCIMPFWIDTEGYTARDRDMFVCGYEFCRIYEWVRDGGRGMYDGCIHSENEDRIRMMCGKLGLTCDLMQTPSEGWMCFEVNDP